MLTDAPTPYDEVPYTSYPYPQSHPDRLAAIATLFGMQPPAVGECRVLELGCASGGNLIPMAVALPGSRFLGLDLSSRQIEKGKATIAELDLKNVDLEHRSILDVRPELGRFDFILCHGVWSWVPPDVRKKIFSICAEQLAPQGVAFVSYNTYPGWHLRGTVRDMMVFHTRKNKTPKDRVGHARGLLDFLVKTVPEEKNAYGMLLKNEMELLRNKADSYLLHEHLEFVNEPVYFYQFEEQAAAGGLQYLGEAELGSMSAEGFGAEADAILRKLATNLVEHEQYLDFLRNRTFRQTLLCHREMKLERRIDPDRLRRLYVASPLRPSTPPVDPLSRASAEFQSPRGKLSTSEPILKAALNLLAECWPQAMPFDRLVAAAQVRIYREPVDASRSQADARRLGSSLIDCFAKKCVELRASAVQCVCRPSELPLASPLARRQAASGRIVTSLTHAFVELSDIHRQVLQLADGTRNETALLDALVDRVGQGQIVVPLEAGAPSDAIRATLAESLRKSLERLAHDALLLS